MFLSWLLVNSRYSKRHLETQRSYDRDDQRTCNTVLQNLDSSFVVAAVESAMMRRNNRAVCLLCILIVPAFITVTGPNLEAFSADGWDHLRPIFSATCYRIAGAKSQTRCWQTLIKQLNSTGSMHRSTKICKACVAFSHPDQPSSHL